MLPDPELKIARTLKESNYNAILAAASNEYWDVTEYLLAQLPRTEQLNAIEFVIRWAALEGQLAVTEHLLAPLSEPDKLRVINGDIHAYLQNATSAALGGFHPEIYLSHLRENERDELLIIKSASAIACTVENAHLNVIDYFFSQLSGENELRTCKKIAIRKAAQSGRLAVIKRVLAPLSKADRVNAIVSGDYQAIRFAAKNDHSDVIEHFLQHKEAFS